MPKILQAKAGSRVTLYQENSGQAFDFHPVDARECLARGGWSLEPPEKPEEKKRPGRRPMAQVE